MAIIICPGQLLIGTASERNALSTTNMLTSTRFYETDTERTVRWNAATSEWIFPESFFEAPTWFIHKLGTKYIAKSGYLGYAPTSAIDTSLNNVWNYITGSASNFHQGAPDGATTGGSIVFGKGKFTFNEPGVAGAVAWPNSITSTIAPFGVHISGQGRTATWVEFTPTVLKEAGLELKNIQYSSISNMFIRVNNFVSNAIKINADTGTTSNNTVHSILIDNVNSAAFLDQRGIYLYGNSTHDTFFTVLRDIYMRYIYHGVEIAGPSGNNSGHTYDNINFWRAEKGITLCAATSLNQISNIGHQGVTTSIGIYTISLKSDATNEAKQNNIFNIWGDSIDKAGSAVVILEARTRFNNISNVVNNSGYLVLDNSGNITNNYTNLIGFGHPSIQNRHRTARWYSSGSNTWDGFMTGRATIISGGTPAHYFDPDFGKAATFIPGASAGTQTGFFGDTVLVSRRMAPIFYVRFKMNSASDYRLLFALTNDILTPGVITDTYKNDKACVGLIVQAGASPNFRYITKNTTAGTPTVSNILNTAGAAIPSDAGITPTSPDFTPHQLWIKGDPVNARWLLSLDSNTPMILNTDVPGDNDGLTPLFVLQYTTGTARTITLYDIRLSSQT